jgi:hypothetical protein
VPYEEYIAEKFKREGYMSNSGKKRVTDWTHQDKSNGCPNTEQKELGEGLVGAGTRGVWLGVTTTYSAGPTVHGTHRFGGREE